MSNEPIFQKLAREYTMRGKSYEHLITPYLSPVMPLGVAKQPLMDTPVYTPDPHLDGPFKEPLPKRNLAQLIHLPEPDPEFTKKFQEFITTAPMQILQGTPAGSFIKNMQPVRKEDGDIVLEAEVAIPTGDQRERERAMVPPILRALQGKTSPLISEEDTANTLNTPEQTDESVNAASNEENDEDAQPVILAPNFWKISDEE